MKNDWLAFLKKDTFQAFLVLLVVYTLLLAIKILPVEYYVKLMGWGIAGLFGSELTNIRLN